MNKDFYNILGVSENATDDEIKKSYRRLAKKYHPDANPGDKQSESKFKEISEAHEILSDKSKRSQYDQMRRYGGTGFTGSRPGPSGQQFDPNDLSSAFGEFGGFGSFADIFSSLFGGGEGFASQTGGFRSNRPLQGDDILSEIDIPFKTAVEGGKIFAKINMSESCNICGGSGLRPGSSMTTCPDCHGRGTISYSHGNFAVSRTCPRCLGRGRVSGQPCGNCLGTGSIMSLKEIAVKIPAGMESGKKIRLKGLGNPGVNGGPPGDLYLRVDINGNHFFWRDGLNIHCRVPIDITQALKGTKLRVKTITGKKIELRIPSESINGSKFRLKGYGLSSNGNKGDQIVEIEIKIPRHMTAEEKKLFDENAVKLGLKK